MNSEDAEGRPGEGGPQTNETDIDDNALQNTAPAPLEPQFENVPPELIRLRQWVDWRSVHRGEKWTKVPFQPDGRPARTNDPSTWVSFEDAKSAYEASVLTADPFSGIGFVFSEDDDFTGFDMDHAMQRDGEIPAHVASMLAQFPFAERSSSGTGAHGIGMAKMPGGSGRKSDKLGWEVYDCRRFFALTGHLIHPNEPMRDVQETVDSIICSIDEASAARTSASPRLTSGREWSPPPGKVLSEEELREEESNFEFMLMYGGDKLLSLMGFGDDDYAQPDWWKRWGYETQSSADFGLCRMLRRWARDDAAQIDRFFRESALMRPKWDAHRGASTYGWMTIGKVLNSEFGAAGERVEDVEDVESAKDGDSDTDGGVDNPPSGGDSGDDKGRRTGKSQWPSLDPAALYGLAGEVVAAIDPHTEADPVAVLVNFLVAFGNACDHGPYFPVGATRHYANENALHVGRTAKARKGESLTPVVQALDDAAPSWRSRRVSGLSTGEGLIHAVRDPSEPKEVTDAKTHATKTVIEDPGVIDKRLCVLETEFARVLRVMARPGNTLSAILRDAFDGRHLQVMTRSKPLEATDAHISILAHITEEELRRELTSTEIANGFGNRFCLFCVKRSKLLPEPEPLEGDAFNQLSLRIAERLNAVSFGQVTRMSRSPDASRRWRQIYEELSAPELGLAGNMLARGEAHVLRWSMNYALTDASAVIEIWHLEAAIALWRYSEASVRYLFGEATGDDIADVIAAELRKRGRMTATQVSELLGRNTSASRIAAAMQMLEQLGRARSVDETRPAGVGRPATVWEWTGH